MLKGVVSWGIRNKVERLQLHEWPESDMIDTLKHYTSLALHIKEYIEWAVEQSYKITKDNKLID